MPTNNPRLQFPIQSISKCRRCLALAVMLSLWLALPLARAGVIVTNLVLFNGTNGANPEATLIQGADGNLYGTTYSGGTNGDYGTVFQMTTNGSFATLFSFSGTNGANPSGALVQGADGILYGTTSNGGTNGGYGTVFKITTNGAFTSLLSFNNTNGANPAAALIMGTNGSFYGTTGYGGSNGLGTVFKITTNGSLTPLVSFNNTNGANPQCALALGGDGNFYGTTSAGGAIPAGGTNGTVFKMTSGGALTSLFSFGDTNGSSPFAGLAPGANGMLYGATVGGGANGNINGTLFQITTNGVLMRLISLNGTNGAAPYATPIQGADGNFYGTTTAGGASNNNFGTVYEMTPGGALAALYSFSGAFPFAGLIQGRDGNFYGTTYGGITYPSGTIFRLTITRTPPVIQAITQNGQTVALVWTAMLGNHYQVQYTTGLSPSNWHNLGSPITATGATATASDAIGPDPQRFYRVALLP